MFISPGTMAVPPAFSDLGKSAKDIFNKGYGNSNSIHALHMLSVLFVFCSAVLGESAQTDNYVIFRQLFSVYSYTVTFSFITFSALFNFLHVLSPQATGF